MTFLDFLRLTRANLLVILGAVTVGVLVMFVHTLTQPVLYTSTSQGSVVVGTATTTGELLSNATLQQERAESYAGLIGDVRVAQEVTTTLDLPDPPEAIVGALSAAAGTNGQLSVSATAETPERARDLANAGVKGLSVVAHDVENAGLREGAQESDLVKLVPAETALLPSAPSSPDYQRNLLLGAAAGLVAGYALALLRRSVDRKVRSVHHVEAAGISSVVGIIPSADPLSKRSRGVAEDLGVVAESFRQMRTNLRFVDVDNPPRSIVVTSANPGEGKSTVSSNLAKIMAAAGQSVLLVDADLRKPSIATTFDLDPAVGLTQVLVGDLTVADVLQDTNTPNLRVMTAGRIPPNPSELLGSQRMHALIAELTKDHMVILDAPPLLPVTDAGLLSVTCDGCLLVIAVGKTAVEQVELCCKVLAQVGGRMLGAVLNMAPTRGIGGVVYGYGYGYSNYGSGYYGRATEPEQPPAEVTPIPAQDVRPVVASERTPVSAPTSAKPVGRTTQRASRASATPGLASESTPEQASEPPPAVRATKRAPRASTKPAVAPESTDGAG